MGKERKKAEEKENSYHNFGILKLHHIQENEKSTLIIIIINSPPPIIYIYSPTSQHPTGGEGGLPITMKITRITWTKKKCDIWLTSDVNIFFLFSFKINKSAKVFFKTKNNNQWVNLSQQLLSRKRNEEKEKLQK